MAVIYFFFEHLNVLWVFFTSVRVILELPARNIEIDLRWKQQTSLFFCLHWKKQFLVYFFTLLSQSQAMAYISSHQKVLHKKMFLKALQNWQENSYDWVSFSCSFNKKEALAQLVSYKFSEIGLTPKYKGQMCAKVYIYILCVCKSNLP